MAAKINNGKEIQERLKFAKNYNDWIVSQFEEYFGDKIIEIGCAIGNITERLLKYGFVYAIDIDKDYVNVVKKRFKKSGNFAAEYIDVCNNDFSKYKANSISTVICFNVLEHIKNDCLALRNMYSVLPVNGKLCLLIPAFKFLYGQMDKTDNHYRRYGKSEILSKVELAGFRVKVCRYMNAPGFFGWLINSRVFKKRYIPFRQMLLLERLIPAIRFLEHLIPVPFGQSIVVVAEKPEESD